MDFVGATKEILKGKKVKRIVENGILTMFIKNDIVCFKYVGTGHMAIPNVDVDDLKATNWELLEEENHSNLSEKAREPIGMYPAVYSEEDVKIFIKKIKNKCRDPTLDGNDIEGYINEYAGDRFIVI